MTSTRKLGVSAVFSIGVLAIACATGRLITTIGVDHKGDMTYTLSPAYIWAFAEVTCVMLVFCLPALPKLFSKESGLHKMIQFTHSWVVLNATVLTSETRFGIYKDSSSLKNETIYTKHDKITTKEEIGIMELNRFQDNDGNLYGKKHLHPILPSTYRTNCWNSRPDVTEGFKAMNLEHHGNLIFETSESSHIQRLQPCVKR
jgi:hypothetical protein